MYLALDPVSAAIATTLNVSAMLALAPAGWAADLAQGTTYPCGLFEVDETRQLGGFGTKPGVGRLPEIGLRLHVFSQYAGWREADAILAKAIELLADPPAVSGYSSWAIFNDRTIRLPDQVVQGQTVKELFSEFRLYVEAE